MYVNLEVLRKLCEKLRFFWENLHSWHKFYTTVTVATNLNSDVSINLSKNDNYQIIEVSLLISVVQHQSAEQIYIFLFIAHFACNMYLLLQPYTVSQKQRGCYLVQFQYTRNIFTEILPSKEREIHPKSPRKSFHYLSNSKKDVWALALRFYQQD